MGVQTSVAFDPAVAIEGMVSRSYATRTRDRVAQAEINNGRLVVQGTTDGTCKLPASSGDVTGKAIGISPYRATQMPGWPPGATSAHYHTGQTIGAVSGGGVWVLVEEAVVAQDPVFVRFAAGGGGSNLGAFRKSADTATAVQLPGAVYMTSAGAGGLALVEINLPA